MLASRIRNYGGDLEIASGASLALNEFEFVLFEGEHPARYFWYLMGVATRQVQKMRGVRVLRGRCAEVLTPAHIQIDGEYTGLIATTIQIIPGALHLLLPPAYG